jgi:hypothetical protein
MKRKERERKGDLGNNNSFLYSLGGERIKLEKEKREDRREKREEEKMRQEKTRQNRMSRGARGKGKPNRFLPCT